MTKIKVTENRPHQQLDSCLIVNPLFIPTPGVVSSISGPGADNDVGRP